MLKHNLVVDLNLVEQLKEVRKWWDQDTAIAKKKRKEFLDNAKVVGGTALTIFLIGYLRGHRRGIKDGSIQITINERER